MSSLVIDASLTMAWCFPDEATAYADAALERVAQDGATVPTIWPMEVANVLVLAERRGRITERQASRFLDLLRALPIVVDVGTRERIWEPIWSLARAHALTVYDASYLDIAMQSGLPLATQDRRLKVAAMQAGVPLF